MIRSVDILDDQGNIITRQCIILSMQEKQWETCQQMSGFLYTNENCKTHPAYLHEHTWNWSDGIPKRSK